MDSVVITGATSMVGIALVKECIKNGTRVLAIVRPGSRNISRLPKSDLIQMLESDLEDLDVIDSLNGYIGGVFFHLGWENTDKAGRLSPKMQSDNIGVTLSSVRLANRLGCKKFVGAGSQAEYGIHKEAKTTPGSYANPITAYGITKLCAGKLASIEAGKFGMAFSWIRIFSLYGEYESKYTLIRTVIPKMLKNERCDLTKGVQQWDYLNVSDAAEAFYLVGEKSEGNKFYCLGSGHSKTIAEYIQDIKAATGSDSELDFGSIPYEFEIPNGMCADISDLSNDTGWKPKTLFKNGIREIIDREYCNKWLLRSCIK